MGSAQDISPDEVLACEGSFFAALLAGDHDALGMILAADFPLIDVLSGQVVHRDESRYTHVLAREGGRWRLVSAQGTPIRVRL